MGEYVDSIIVFFSEHKDFIMTIATMVIGIVAGWFPTLKRISQIILTVITTILFPILVIMCYQDLTIVKLSIGVSLLWCLLSLFVFRKEEVSRRKIGKLIIKFTKSADKDQPICIFGGDLNFFGSFILNNRRWNLFNLNRNKYIETNEQYIQIRDDGFREIRILAIKPYSDSEKDRNTRIRIGYIIEELKDRVQIKFFDQRKCETCKENDECTTCNCNTSSRKSKCKKPNQKCSKLENLLINSCYNPDITLRGRIVTLKDNKSPCVAIATTKESGKKYILREYSSIEKECKLYTIIWDVWWSKCKIDPKFIQRCRKEYLDYRNKGAQ